MSSAAIHIFDLPTGLIVRSSTDNTVARLSHRMTISSIALSQTGPTSERQLALLDYNRDLYVVTVKDTKPKFVKLGKFNFYSLVKINKQFIKIEITQFM